MTTNNIKGEIRVGKKKTDKWNTSNFHVTVNPNVTDDRLSPKKLKSVISSIFGNVKDYIKIIRGTNVEYKDIDAEFTVEKGELQHRVHAHILVTIVHNAIIQLDLTKIRKQLELSLNLKGIKVQVEVWKDNKRSLQDYLRKNNK